MLLPLFILVIATLIGRYFFLNPPVEKKRNAQKRPVISVETLTLEPQEYQVKIHAFGTVQPGSKGSVVSQIQGVITELGHNIQAGSFFSKGDLFFKIDDRDYLAALKITEASLSEASAKLVEEEARSDQALRNWQRLGKGAEATDLVLRKPYLATAQAAVLSAEAKKEQAQLALERTRILAPYTGRVLEKIVDIGQFVSVGSRLAEIYATHNFEVRIPLNRRQQELLDLPEQSSTSSSLPGPEVEISSGQGAKEKKWQGRVLRTEAILDPKNQQLFVVVRIIQSFPQQESSNQLPEIGQFVRVAIQGKIFNKVFLIPSHTLYTNNEVIIFHDGKLARRQVDVINRGEQYTVVGSGLVPGEQLVTTPLGAIITGTEAEQVGRKKREH
ncbi:MAG: efflux RND transporter periplasmic adaptor subunit [Thermodesulfobacteriota bacterium]|nr:efflux RND transporter periplasmic adaptor subunit [Thermodesulfobacteriota bacterium]